MFQFQEALWYVDEKYNFIVEGYFSLIIKAFFFIKFVLIILLYTDFFSMPIVIFFDTKNFVIFSFLSESNFV